MAVAPHYLNELFGAQTGQSEDAALELRLIEKHGRPFLHLPRHGRAAAATLALYPAQTTRARMARAALKWTLAARLPIAGATVRVSISSRNPFVEFVRKTAAGYVPAAIEMPMLGMLAGNPAGDAQRFLVLLFDAGQRPRAVIKCAFSPKGRALVRREASFLGSVPTGKPGIPPIGPTLDSERVSAFAMDFCPGDSPKPGDEIQLSNLLHSWLLAGTTGRLADTASWAQLESGEMLMRLGPRAQALAERKITSTIQHGDLTPWNIKVAKAGRWTVLDWERGELNGVPGWDWFHYVVQPEILVARRRTEELIARVEKMLGTEPFARYVRDAAIDGIERNLMLAYLLHCVEVIKPAEGLEECRRLLHALLERWNQAVKSG